MESTKKPIEDEVFRDQFFAEHWPNAQRQSLNMLLVDKWDNENALMMAKGVAHLVSMINDMREIELNYRAEIAAMKALNKAKE